MSRWYKRVLLWGALAIGVVLFGCGCVTAPRTAVVSAVADPSQISVPGAYSFVSTDDGFIADNTVIGVFLTRASKYGTTYHGSVDAKDIIDNNNLTSFNPTYTALVKSNDVWENVPVNNQGQCEGPFRIDSAYNIEESPKTSINWYLDADAPAAVYGIKCTYADPNTWVLYTSPSPRDLST